MVYRRYVHWESPHLYSHITQNMVTNMLCRSGWKLITRTEKTDSMKVLQDTANLLENVQQTVNGLLQKSRILHQIKIHINISVITCVWDMLVGNWTKDNGNIILKFTRLCRVTSGIHCLQTKQRSGEGNET